MLAITMRNNSERFTSSSVHVEKTDDDGGIRHQNLPIAGFQRHLARVAVERDRRRLCDRERNHRAWREIFSDGELQLGQRALWKGASFTSRAAGFDDHSKHHVIAV